MNYITRPFSTVILIIVILMMGTLPATAESGRPVPDIVVPGDTLTMTGTPGNDTFLLSANSIQLNGGPLVTYSGMENIVINADSGSDTLTIDLGSGFIGPATTFNGQGGYDTLILSGSPSGSAGSATYTPGPTNDAGQLVYSGSPGMTIDFTGLEPIVDTVPAVTLTINATGNANQIDYTTGSVPTQAKVQIDSFELIEFNNKTNLIIEALGSPDVITWNNPYVPTGLTTVTINGGTPAYFNDPGDILNYLSPDPFLVNLTMPLDGTGNITQAGMPPLAFTSIEFAPPSEVRIDDDWAGTNPGSPVGGHTFGYDAFDIIQDGINAVASSGIVKVAAGTYNNLNPLGTGTQVAYVNKPLTLAGGYLDPNWTTPDPTANITTIDAQNSGRGIYWGPAAGGTISGFTVTNGVSNIGGGGIYIGATIFLTDCTVSDNSSTSGASGGGMFIQNGTPTIFNCLFDNNASSYAGGGVRSSGNAMTLIGSTFTSNQADIYYGGGLQAGNSPLTAVDCIFDGNTIGGGAAPFHEGGALYATGSDVKLTNCAFLNNTSVDDAGAVYVTGPGPVLTNCTFWNNSATDTAGALETNETAIVTNCIFWGNSPNEIYTFPGTPTVTYSDVQGGFTGTGNINQDPLFIGGGDLHLQGMSPCIDTGTDSAPGLAGITTDLDGNPRFVGTVDMGVYEMQMDFGDAPDPTYPTLLASDGARHGSGALLLGSTKDFELDGQPAAASDGDDNNGIDDEDGITFTSPLYTYLTNSGTVTLDVVASAACILSGWMDFNMNGSWADSGEDLFPGGQPLMAGTNSLSFQIPPGVAPGTTHARFRATTLGAVWYSGVAPDGEVEDYRVAIEIAPGTIVVEKQTNPDGGTDTFTFTGDASGTIGDDQQIAVSALAAGTYTARESASVGWLLTSIVCDDANSSGDVASGSITFRVEPGETVTCVCTNTQLTPSAQAADSGGAGKDQFTPDESVYGSGSQFTPGFSIDIYITGDLTWTDGMPIPGSPAATAVANGSGMFNIEVWAPPLTIGEYDMVFDANQNGNYDARTDVVDDPNHPGFVVAEQVFGGGPTVGGEVMTVNRSALMARFAAWPISLAIDWVL